MPTIVNQFGLTTTDQIIYTQANQPIVEPLGGNTSLVELMKRFPEEVYAPGPNTRLYKLVSALCGDSGAGLLKAQSLVIRLKNEGPLLVFHDLDTFYSHIFNFPRIRRELYNYDAAANTLLDTSYDPTNISVEKQIWDKIHAADDSYRRRVNDFMAATRWGNSPKGIILAAKAGSGEDCDVVENYRWVFDQFSDDDLDLEHLGDTNGTGEFSVMPAGTANTNDNVDANVVTLTLLSSPTGDFTLSYETATTGPITVDGSDISNSIYLALLGLSGGTLFGLTDVTITVDPSSNYIYTITLNDPQLDALFFGMDDSNLVSGTGSLTYPLGDSYYMADFQYPLASFYEANLGAIEAGTLDDSPSDSDYDDNVAVGPTVYLTPDIEYNMIRTLDHLRPIGTVMSVKPKRSSDIKVEARGQFASSENFNLVRWVTGNPSVAWPPRDAGQGFFIQGIVTESGITANVENESTTFAYGSHVFPALFQTIDSVFAYSEGALADDTYNTIDFFTDHYRYWKSEHIGSFDRIMSMVFPIFQSTSDSDQFLIPLAIPNQPTPLVTHYPFMLS